MRLALGAIVITLALMLPTAIWVHLRIPKARGLVETLTVLPYVVPPIALVVGVIGAYQDTAPWFFNSKYSLIPFYAVLAMPFTYRSLDAGLRAIDLRTLVDASRSCGAGWATTMFRVLVPNLRVSLLTSAFLTATVVMGEFTMAALMGKTTLQVFTQQFSQRAPQAAFALGLLMLVVTTALLATRHVPHPRPRRRSAVAVGLKRSPPWHRRSTYQGIRKTFAGAVAIESFDLAMEPGELVSLLGPSGCGKTTALRIAAGFERPTRGRSSSTAATSSARRPTTATWGWCSRATACSPTSTSAPTSPSGCACAGCPRPTRQRRVGEALERVHLTQLAKRYPHQLSGGQQQRVALARALVFEPAVLLLDEPLSALDAKVRVNLREEIRRLQLQLGMTTLFVTHDQEEALSISDRIGVMSNGRLEQLGTPREVYAEPATGVRRPLRRADQRAAGRGHRRRARGRRRAHRRQGAPAGAATGAR